MGLHKKEDVQNAQVYTDYLKTMYSVTPKDAKPDELESFLFSNEPLPNGGIPPRQFVIDYIDKNF